MLLQSITMTNGDKVSYVCVQVLWWMLDHLKFISAFVEPLYGPLVNGCAPCEVVEVLYTASDCIKRILCPTSASK